MLFLHVNIIHEKGKFTTSVYRKPTFSGIYTHFDSFLPSSNKIGLLHTLLYRCFRICSDWTKFHLELVKLTDVFKNNGYPENFINNCFKVFLDNKYRIQEKVTTVPKKTLFLVLPYLGPLSLQTRTKLRKSLLIAASYRLCFVLTKENKFLLELKESFLIMRDKTSLNRNIRSAPLCLFDKV